jgi:putative transferase (TIGR04331 family)
MALLATTAIESTWGDSEELLFLGEWCKRYERQAKWQARPHEVVRYHWNDRTKLRHDYRRLKRLHYELLHELERILGEQHRLERPARYWQILLDPWLSMYLAVVFDRWECLRVAFEDHDISKAISLDRGRRCPVIGHVDFIDAVSGDEWNHEIFSDILRFEYAKQCSIQLSPLLNSGRSHFARRTVHPRNWKWRLASILDQWLGRLGRNNAFAFVHPYFPLRAYLQLCFRLRKIPNFYLREFEWLGSPAAGGEPAVQHGRGEIILKRLPEDRFESFVHTRIASDLPQVFWELFGTLGQRCSAIGARPKAIFTANDHAHNDIFKRWAAEKVHERIPFVILEHGSGIPPLFGAMDCEEEMADVKVTWARPFRSKQVRLPANKLAGHRPRVTNTRNPRLLVIGQEMPRYAFDARSMPIGAQTLSAGYDYICRFHEALTDKPRRAFLVKPYPNLGWNTQARFIERLGAEKVSVGRSLAGLMRRAKMVVCTYPQTTFSEAVNCDRPTILVYARAYWETMPQFDDLIEVLHDARVVFFDPEAASDHVNAIWTDPMAWWRSPKVSAALRNYEAEALDLRSGWIEPWAQFVRQVRSELREQVELKAE